MPPHDPGRPPAGAAQRWVAWGAAGLLLFTAAVYSARRLLDPLRARAESAARAALPGRDVRIRGISTNFINSLSVSGIEISNPGGFGSGTFLEMEALRVSVRLGGRLAVEAFQPRLVLERMGSAWNAPLFSGRGGGVRIPASLRVQDGRIFVRDGGKIFDGLEFHRVRGTLDLGGAGAAFEVSAESPDDESLLVSGSLDRAGFFSGKIAGRNIRPQSVLDRIPSPGKPRGDSGRVDLEAGLSGRWPAADSGKPSLRHFSGSVRFRRAGASLPAGPALVPVSADGEILFSDEKIRTDGLKVSVAGARIVLSGALDSPLSDPRGRASFAVTEGSFLALPFSANGSLELSSGIFTLSSFSGNWGTGEISGEGRASEKELKWSCRASRLPVAGLFARRYPNEPPRERMTGELDVRVRGTGTPAEPRTSGRLVLKDFSWADGPKDDLTGTLTHRKGNVSLSFRSRSGPSRLALEAFWDRAGFRLDPLWIRPAGPAGESFRLTAVLDRETRALSGKAAGRRVSIHRLAPFVRALSRIRGSLDCEAALSGTLSAPEVRGVLAGRNLTLPERDREKTGNFRSAMTWNRERFSLDDFSIGKEYRGSFSYRIPEKSFEIDARASAGNPGILLALTGGPADVHADVSGRIKLSGRAEPDLAKGEAKWEGEGRLTLGRGRWGRMEFESLDLDYRFDPGDLRVNALAAQKEGSLKLSANSSQSSPENPAEAAAELDRFRIGDGVLNGSASFRGLFRIDPKNPVSGTVESADFTYNGFGAGRLTSAGGSRGTLLSLGDFTWGSFFRGGCTLLFAGDASPKIEGRWSSTAKTFAEWNKLLGTGDLPLSGRMALSGSVQGNLSDMAFTLASRFSDLRFRPGNGKEEESPAMNGEAEAVLSQGMIRTFRAGLSDPEGGAIGMVGQIDLRSRNLSLECTLEKVDDRFLFHPWGWKELSGLTGGRLSIGGLWASPVVQGSLSGTGGAAGKILLESWEAAGIFQESELLFSNFIVRGKGGSWRFSVLKDSWIRPRPGKGSGTFKLGIDFANLSLGPMFAVGQGEAEGGWGPGPGGGEAVPVFEGRLRMSDLTVNETTIDPFEAAARYRSRTLEFLPMPGKGGAPRREPITGRIDFSADPCVRFKQLALSGPGGRALSMDGRWCPDLPVLEVDGTGMDASLIASMLQVPFTVAGESDFHFSAKADGDQPAFSGSLAVRKGRVAEIPFDELRSDFSWRSGFVDIQRFDLKGRDTVTVSGRARLPVRWGNVEARSPALDVKADFSDGNLSLLDRFDIPWMRGAQGSFSGSIAVAGTPSRPSAKGNLSIRNASFDSKYLTRRLEGLDLDADLKSNLLTVEKTDFRAGKSRCSLEGTLRAGLDGGDLSVDDFTFRLETLGREGLPLQIPELPAVRQKLGIPSVPSKGKARIRLAASGNSERQKVSGEVLIEDALLSYPPPKSRDGAGSGRADRVEWDLVLKAGGRTVFQNDFAYARILGELRLQGEPRSLKVRGKVSSSEGTLTLYGAKFDLKEAALEITGPQTFSLAGTTVSAAPAEGDNVVYLAFQAEQNTFVTDVQGNRAPDTITLKLERMPLTGDFDSKKVTFRSSQNPDLPSERVANRAGLGVSLEGLTPEERDVQLRAGVARLLDSQLASPLARAILQRTGLVDKIEISQDADAAGRSTDLRGSVPSAIDPLIGQSILLERTFGPRLGVGYKATVDKIQDRADLIHQLQLRYPFYKNIWLYGSRELDSRENLGRDPETRGGIQTQFKFDPADWFRRGKEDQGPEPGKDK